MIVLDKFSMFKNETLASPKTNNGEFNKIPLGGNEKKSLYT